MPAAAVNSCILCCELCILPKAKSIGCNSCQETTQLPIAAMGVVAVMANDYRRWWLARMRFTESQSAGGV